jgi:uncharacterized protein YodC (DUF2158 family)
MNVNFRCGPQRESSECSRLYGMVPCVWLQGSGERDRVFGYSLLEQLQQLFKLISILSLYLYYSVTLYLFVQTNSLTVFSIYSLLYLNIHFLFFYPI